MPAAFLELEAVETHFPVKTGFIFKRRLGTVRAVDGVRLSIQKGEVLGLVGESGCGKSTLGRTILQLIPATSGTVILEGRHLNRLSPRELRRARADFQMIFQDPYASLNPRMTVFETLAEATLAHKKVPRRALRGRVITLKEKVGLPPQWLKNIRTNFPEANGSGSRLRAHSRWSPS